MDVTFKCSQNLSSNFRVYWPLSLIDLEISAILSINPVIMSFTSLKKTAFQLSPFATITADDEAVNTALK